MRARDNPFRVDRQQSVTYRLPGVSWDELMTRLRAMNHRGAIVGGHGSGKSTLLSHLEARLKQEGLAVLSRFVNSSTPAPWRVALHLETLWPGQVLLFDGFGHLPRWAQGLVRFRTRQGGLIVTLHEPGSLPTILTCRPSIELLEELIDELTDHDASARRQAAALFDKHHGNIRDVLRELYDVHAAGPS